MFENVLVGIGDYDAGRDAVSLATRLARPGRPLTLARIQVVAHKPAADSGWVREENERKRELGELGALRDEMHVDAGFVSAKALSVARGLHELVRLRHSDLLVISESRQRGLDRMMEGDDVQEVLRDAPSAVAVAPRGAATARGGLKEIGVAYDQSRGSEQALRLARALAAENQARVSEFQADPDDGEVAEDLGRLAGSVDLLVLGPHHYRRAGRLFATESVSQQLADRPTAPLLVLPAA